MTCFGCHNAERKPVEKIEKNFGLFTNENDSIAVELKLTEFKIGITYSNGAEQIVCNDSLPKITIENDSVIKKGLFQKSLLGEFRLYFNQTKKCHRNT